jgi:hypothetical protein
VATSGWLDALMTQAVVGDSVEMKLGTQVLEDKHAHSGVDLVDRKAKSIEGIEQKLSAAKKRNALPAVIKGYEKLLAQLSE